MNLKEMLLALSDFYQIKSKDEDATLNIINRYHELIKGYVDNKEYDWKQVLTNIQLNRKYSTFPTVPEIIDNLTGSEKKKEYVEDKDEGALLIIESPYGYKYKFTVSGVSDKNFSQLKNELNKRLGTFKLKKYPKGTVIIGDKVFLPSNKDTLKIEKG